MAENGGHGLIDILELPVLGREEDAADALSAFLIHDLWQEGAAVDMVYRTTGAFQAHAIEAEADGYEPVYWGQHSLDMQRHPTLICLFYGANPEERAEPCIDEFQRAEASRGAKPDDLAPGPRGW